MFGVILWSDQSDRNAVIWCEDQGDLAFYKCPSEKAEENMAFDAGDFVQFDIHVENATRRAQNPRLVIEQPSSVLPITLRQHAATPRDKTHCTAEIIPFGLRATNRSTSSKSVASKY